MLHNYICSALSYFKCDSRDYHIQHIPFQLHKFSTSSRIYISLCFGRQLCTLGLKVPPQSHYVMLQNFKDKQKKKEFICCLLKFPKLKVHKLHSLMCSHISSQSLSFLHLSLRLELLCFLIYGDHFFCHLVFVFVF